MEVLGTPVYSETGTSANLNAAAASGEGGIIFGGGVSWAAAPKDSRSRRLTRHARERSRDPVVDTTPGREATFFIRVRL